MSIGTPCPPNIPGWFGWMVVDEEGVGVDGRGAGRWIGQCLSFDWQYPGGLRLPGLRCFPKRRRKGC